MNVEKDVTERTPFSASPIFGTDAFFRLDESDDLEFYSRDRFVSHLDSLALTGLEKEAHITLAPPSEGVQPFEPIQLDPFVGWPWQSSPERTLDRF